MEDKAKLRACISVRVHPYAKRTELAGMLGQSYKVNVAAPALGGAVNDECIAYMAKIAGTHQARVRILRGFTNRTKVLEVQGISQQDLERKLREGQ